MPALRPVPPQTFREVLESRGWKIVAADDLNWVLARNEAEFPIVVPRAAKLLAIEVMSHLLDRAGLKDGECLGILQSMGYTYPTDPFPFEDDEPAS